MAQTPPNIPPNVDAAVGYNYLNTMISTAVPEPPGAAGMQQASLGDSSSACSISQTSISSCTLENISIIDCTNTSITCDSITGKSDKQLNCNLSAAVQQAWNQLMSMNLTPSQEQALITIMASTGVSDEQGFYDIVTQYLTQRCQGVQNSVQSIFIPNITLHGPYCDDDTVFALNRLDQIGQCTMSNLQQLLRLAGLEPSSNGPLPPPYSPIQLPRVTLFWLAIGLVVILIIAIVIGAVIRKHRHK